MILLPDYDVIIIGGGAAGLMCAITAGQRGRSVLVIERANKVGKKILMSGGGRCNFTNLYIDPECYLSANPHFCKSALSRYTQWDFTNLVEKHAIAYHEKTQGQLFCDTTSKAILGMLLSECEQTGIEIRTECDVGSVKGKDSAGSFRVKTSDGEFLSESLVIASGGLSIPTMGSTGFAYELAEQFGLKLKPTSPALVPFTFTDSFKQLSGRLTGISLPVCVTTGKKSFTGNILFTHRGLSGPAVLQLSSYWRTGDTVKVDLLPGLDASQWLLALKQDSPKALLRNALRQHLPKKLVLELEQLWWQEHAERILSEWPDRALRELAENLSDWRLKPAGTEGYRTAEVTLGGIDTDGISSKTMECKRHPGLYFIGEALDVTGHLGGFNFQWAWASGFVAGQVV